MRIWEGEGERKGVGKEEGWFVKSHLPDSLRL